MPGPSIPSELVEAARLGAVVLPGVQLARHTWWRVGGCAEWWVEVHDTPQLQAVQASGLPITVLGNGSNVLVSDAGVPGVVLRLEGKLAGLVVDGTEASAGAGLKLVVLLARLDALDLAGAEAFAGVPGTVGGAVVMNAGTTLGDASDVVTSVTVVERGGAAVQLAAASLAFGYRTARLPPGAVVASATLALTRDQVHERRERRRLLLARRKATQPLHLPSCGSTFTNPPGTAAGWLIDQAGLKGLRRGAAEVSHQHANFLVNTGGATAEDLRWLIATVRQRVRDHSGVWLLPEVHLVGTWPEGALDEP